jgi:4-hydroxybenzoate polyprenyltransferase
MAAIIYFLCALTAFACFALLWRGWKTSRGPLLLWSALCFAGLTVSNVLLVVDKLVLPDRDLSPPRLVITLFALLLLIFGLVWGDDR